MSYARLGSSPSCRWTDTPSPPPALFPSLHCAKGHGDSWPGGLASSLGTDHEAGDPQGPSPSAEGGRVQVAQWTAAPFSGVTGCSGPDLQTGQLMIPKDLRKQDGKRQPSLSGDSGAQRQGWRASGGGPPPITAAPPLCSATPQWMLGALWVCIRMPLPEILQTGKLRSRGVPDPTLITLIWIPQVLSLWKLNVPLASA